jgi:hypothetical protein
LTTRSIASLSRRELGDDLRRRVRLGQISDDGVGRDLVLRSQLGGEGLEPIAAPRRQHDGIALLRQQFGECLADAGRGAGHERCLPRSLCHGGIMDRPAPKGTLCV